MRKYARLAIAIFGVVFAGFVALQFRRTAPATSAPPVVRTDPTAVVESTGGNTLRFNKSREDVDIAYEKLLTYADGSSKLAGVRVTTEDRNVKGRTFTITGKQGTVAQNESTIVLDGDVRLTASDGFSARTEHATYTSGDGSVTATGPAEFSRDRMTGSGIGLRYDKARDVLTIPEQAVVHIAADEHGAGAADVSSASAAFARRDKYLQFDGNVRITRGAQTIEADNAIARLSEDEKRVQTLELHNHARITGSSGGMGSLRSMSGADMTLTYAADGQSLERAIIFNDAAIELAGDAGGAGRRITAKTIDIAMTPDGSTPKSLAAREGVELTFPAEGATPARTIRAASLDATGADGRGLTHANFTGGVQFRERGGDIDRAASSATLEVAMKPGMGAIDEARFAHAVRFEEGRMLAQSAAARYDLTKGTLALSGSEAGSVTPRVVNERIAVDATRIDVTLAGPIVKADGAVKSTLQPAKASANERLPAMLKQDQPVSVVADNLAYDGAKSAGTYTGNARLFQGDTTIKGDTITIDEKDGGLTASGHVLTTTSREQVDKDKKKQRVQSTATSNDLKYEDDSRRLTYTGAAHMVGPEGDMSAGKIVLYLKPSGDELERAEANADEGEKLTLREQNRTTTGAHMTYAADQERYVVTGLPATVVDECGRETIGRTLTFVKATDTIVVDGNQQIRTQTKGGTGKCS